MKILRFQKSHLEKVLDLSEEFWVYLQWLSHIDHWVHDRESQKRRFLQYAFWSKKAFSGYIVKIDTEIVGYGLYHYGFDPDEMQGKVIYLIDLFVSEKARWKWVWKALIEKLQSHEDSLGIYFWVWKKNQKGIGFYKKMGADWVEDVPFMKLMK